MSENLMVLQNYLHENSGVRKQMNALLKERSPQFLTALYDIVGSSDKLAKADPESVFRSAMTAAALHLPITPSLGQAAVVPYYDNKAKCYKAQFQTMAKGYIQLAIRTGKYHHIYVSEVYADEIKSKNPITGFVEFVDDFSMCIQRDNDEDDNIVLYYASFELKTGFESAVYMTPDSIEKHAKKYSTAYQYDLKNNYKNSPWSTDFKKMARKTVIKRLLTYYGILSHDMESAIINDQKINGSYDDNPKPKPKVVKVENDTVPLEISNEPPFTEGSEPVL